MVRRDIRSALAAMLLLAYVGSVSYAHGQGSGGSSGKPGGQSGSDTTQGDSPSQEPAEDKPSKPAKPDKPDASERPDRSGRADRDDRAARAKATASRTSGAPGTAMGEYPATKADIAAWLASSGTATWLDACRAALSPRYRAALASAVEAGVPPAAFAKRLREAAAKGVPAGVAADAIGADAERWERLAKSLAGSGWPPDGEAVDFYLAAAAAARSGLGEAEVLAVSRLAAESKRDAKAAGAALTAAAAASAAFGIPLPGLAAGIVGSRIAPKDYSAIAEAASQAVAEGIGAERFMRAFEETIARGGSLSRFRATLF